MVKTKDPAWSHFKASGEQAVEGLVPLYEGRVRGADTTSTGIRAR